MRKVLAKTFFERPARCVAVDLIGKYLVQGSGKKECAIMITETEVYDGPGDKASHASRGRTNRTEVMFGPAGHFYVYLCYGMYWMLNVVTGAEEYPAAILIRGAGELDGPGKLTRALKIDNRLNTLPAVPPSGLWFEDRGVRIGKNQIKATPRIGVAYAGSVWANKKLRFTHDA